MEGSMLRLRKKVHGAFLLPGFTLITCLALGPLVACSDDTVDPPKPSCDVKLSDGTCAGVRLPLICGETYCAACSGCQQTGPTCKKTLHVSAGAAGGDGSSGKPYSEIAAAAGKAAAGDCILVASGTYGAATLVGGVSLLGAGADVVTINATKGGYALTVKGGSGGTLRGVSLSGEGRGLLVDSVKGLHVEQLRSDSVRELGIVARKSGGLTLNEVMVRKTRDDGAGKYGVGVVLAEGSQAKLTQVVIQDSASQGLLASESALSLSASTVTGSGLYGVAVDCSVDAACQGALASSIDKSLLNENGGVGLWVRGAKLSVKDSEVGKTKLASGLARGVEVQGKAQIEISGSKIHHSAGQGIVIDDSAGKLTQNRITDNEERGVWIQCSGASNLTLDGNEITDCKMVGVGTVGCTGVTIKGGKVARIKKTPVLVGNTSVEIGDGVQLLDKSDVTVDGVTVDAAGRVGLLIDDAVGTISNSTIDGSAGNLVVQNAQTSAQTLNNNKDAGGKALSATTPTTAYGVVTDKISLISVLPVPVP
jgi:hypothetical protein